LEIIVTIKMLGNGEGKIICKVRWIHFTVRMSSNSENRQKSNL